MNKHHPIPPIRKDASIAITRDNLLYNTESLLEPSVVLFTLWGVAFWHNGNLTAPYLILSVTLFYITFPCGSKIHMPPWRIFRNIILSWALLAGLALGFGVISGFIKLFSLKEIELWLWLTPSLQILAVFILRASASLLLKLQGPQKRTIIAGVNAQGIALAERLAHNTYSTAICLGFFDDRNPERLENTIDLPILGKLAGIAGYVKQHNINTIYLSLPMVTEPRIVNLLDELRDTTVSVYILPDLFLTDLIQGRMGQIDGIPVMAICESPFTGIDSLFKRLTDILSSLFVLILCFPLLLVISIGIKFTSPGQILFKQRRYGLDGKDINVYKFRTMTVCEDGVELIQAKKNDSRVTRLGAFLRKTSLDELPQFFNVLKGDMSIVGPRPHAVAHNEMYRKLIKGYMIRHKVKPGITGWAQVNGLRGETETLDKMRARIEYDIDYMRYWSLRQDIYIIFRTIWVIIKGQDGAY
jgi:putative colanic acid biosynthesis UDP-glucose lipid carrier transferase